MFCFSLGVSHIGDELPRVVYALLSGLNAATVGIIALAAVQLSQKVITDKLTRVLVFLGGAGGMLYTALWYFPILMAAAGIATITWDLKVVQKLARLVILGKRDATAAAIEIQESRPEINSSQEPRTSGASTTSSQRDRASNVASSHLYETRRISTRNNNPSIHGSNSNSDLSLGAPTPPEINRVILSWQRGVIVLVTFFASFLTVMLVRSLYPAPTRTFSLFANLYLAGTIIFGGGPVVIPLLREYVVAEGWVSPRNFLLGLALIQAFPGPNFNFAVYLGALAVSGTNISPLICACVAFLGIFIPGLVVQTGFMGLWGPLRKNRVLLSALRGGERCGGGVSLHGSVSTLADWILGSE